MSILFPLKFAVLEIPPTCDDRSKISIVVSFLWLSNLSANAIPAGPAPIIATLMTKLNVYLNQI